VYRNMCHSHILLNPFPLIIYNYPRIGTYELCRWEVAMNTLRSKTSTKIMHIFRLTCVGGNHRLLKKKKNSIGYEFLISVIRKSSDFWNITPRTSLKVNGPFWGTCHLHLQGRRNRQARSEPKHSTSLLDFSINIISSEEIL
jgi:hypothetical protein